MSPTSQGWVLVAAQLVLLVVLILLPESRDWPVPPLLSMLGAVLRVGGFVAIAVAAVNLGRSLRVHPQPPAGSELKTGGLYRYVRHPIYSGVLLLCAGIAVTSGNTLSIAVVAMLVVVLRTKAGLEERMLRDRFPEYEDYARRTPPFLPRPGSLFM